METKSIAFFVYLALCAAGAYQLIHYYPLMPDTVASHFGAGGQANDWAPKSQLMVIQIFVLVLMGGLFLGIAVLLRHMPSSLINLPNKDYWLAPERREQTLRRLSDSLLWIGNASMLFMLYITQQTFQANLMATPKVGGDVMVVMVVYMGLIMAMTISLFVRFRLPKS